MIIIIIRLLQPHLHSPPFLWNFTNEEHTSMLGMVRKEKHPRYLANFDVNDHPQELGSDATKVISSRGDYSKIDHTTMFVTP